MRAIIKLWVRRRRALQRPVRWAGEMGRKNTKLKGLCAVGMGVLMGGCSLGGPWAALRR